MRNLFVPPGQTLTVGLATSGTVGGYVSYCEGIERQGKVKTAMFSILNSTVSDVFTSDAVLGCTIVGWSIQCRAFATIEVQITVDGNFVCNIPELPHNYRWTEEGIYTEKGELFVTTGSGSNVVSGTLDADTIITGLEAETNTLRKLQDALVFTPAQQLWIN
jgi:hypothetical protein